MNVTIKISKTACVPVQTEITLPLGGLTAVGLIMLLSHLEFWEFLLYGYRLKKQAWLVAGKDTVAYLHVTCVTYDAGSEGRYYVLGVCREIRIAFCAFV